MKYLPRFVSLLLVTALTALGSVSSQTARVAYTISALPATCPTTFPFTSTATIPDLVVLDGGAANAGNSPPVVLTLNSDYTVSGGGYNAQAQLQQGNVVVVGTGTHSVQLGDVITILRQVPLTQTTTLSSSGFLSPIEVSLDKLTLEAQQLNDLIGLSLSFQKNEILNPALNLTARENFGLAFTASGAITYFTPGSGGGGGGGTYYAGTGLTLTSNTFSVNAAQPTISSIGTSPTGLTVAGPLALSDNVTLAAAGKTVTLSDNPSFPTWQGPALNRTAFMLQREGGTALYAVLGAGQNAGYYGYSSGGTFASPSATPLARQLNVLSGGSFGGTTWVANGYVGIFAGELQSEATRGSYIQFGTTPSGSVVPNAVGFFTTAGNFVVGTSNADTGLTGSGGLRVTSTTDATTSTAGAAVFAGGVGVAKKIIAGTEVKAPYGIFTSPIAAFDSSSGGLYLGYGAGTGIVRAASDNGGSYAPISFLTGSSTVAYMDTTGLVMQGSFKAQQATAPTAGIDLTNKTYVDSVAGGAGSIYNVRSYGAVGNGSTNDTTAINLAIAALTNYSTLYFPPGNYLITPGSITELASLSHIMVRGDGASSVIYSSATGAPGNFLVVHSSCDDVTVRDLAIIGSATVRGSGVGLRMYASHSLISNIYFKGTSDFGILVTNDAGAYTKETAIVNCLADQTLGDGFHFGYVTDCSISNCQAYYTWDDGLGIGDDGATGNPPTRVEVANFQSIQAGNHANGGTHGSGIRIFDGATDIHVTGGSIYQSCEAGLQCTRATSTSVYCTRIKVDGLKVYQCIQQAGMYGQINFSFVNQGMVANCWSEAPVSQCCYAFLDCNNLTVTGNTAKDAVVRSFATDDGTTANVAATWSNWVFSGNTSLGTPSNETYYFVPATGKAIANLVVTGNTDVGGTSTNYIFTNRLATAAKILLNTSLNGKAVANGGTGLAPTATPNY